MKRWPTKLLGELVEERSERLGREAVTIYSVTNENGFVRSLDLFDKRVFSANTSNYKRIRFCDLAYNPSRINVGSIAICEDKDGGAVSPMYIIIRCKPSLLPTYLLYFLKSEAGLHQIRHRCEGAVRFQLKFRDLCAIPIVFPPLAEQERIVKLLDEAEKLRKLRAQADQRAAVLIPAVFHEMFNSALRKDEWPTKPLGELTTRITKGESPGWQGFQYTAEGPLFITSKNVMWGSIDLAKAKRIPSEFHRKLSRSAIRADDVLLNLVGASIGRCCLAPSDIGEANINQAVAVISCTDQVLPIYLSNMLLSQDAQSYFHGGKVEAARANISLGDVRRFEIVIPPLALQKEFAGRVAQIRELEAEQAASRHCLETLSHSLLYTAFQGDL